MERRRFLRLLGAGVGLAIAACSPLPFSDRFRINTVERAVPRFDPATWELVVDGLVERPLRLSYHELLGLPSASQVSDFRCVEGWRVGRVRWEGVRLETLMRIVKPLPEAKYVTLHSAGSTYGNESYIESLALSEATLPDSLLAYHMQGKPLPPKHGAPLRMVVAQMFGYKSAKWVTRIEFSAAEVTGYWEKRGWATDAYISKGPRRKMGPSQATGLEGFDEY
ncbi:MAG: molybdopterin-dependent oxidoreductase [Chloroflexi bacterium]|nr:molybdopterin-dependent oxidoreductase [Chloroflexota bacterium]